MRNLIAPDSLCQALTSELKPLVLDVHGPVEYAAGHLPGAVHMPIDQVEAHLEELLRDRPIIPYGTMFHSGSSRGERVTALLQAHGFDAHALAGGFPA